MSETQWAPLRSLLTSNKVFCSSENPQTVPGCEHVQWEERRPKSALGNTFKTQRKRAWEGMVRKERRTKILVSEQGREGLKWGKGWQCWKLGRSQGGSMLKSIKAVLCSDKDSVYERESRKSNLGGQAWAVVSINPPARGRPEFLYLVRWKEGTVISWSDIVETCATYTGWFELSQRLHPLKEVKLKR